MWRQNLDGHNWSKELRHGYLNACKLIVSKSNMFIDIFNSLPTYKSLAFAFLSNKKIIIK